MKNIFLITTLDLISHKYTTPPTTFNEIHITQILPNDINLSDADAIRNTKYALNYPSLFVAHF